MRPCQVVLPVWIRPTKGLGGQITPKSVFYLKISLSETTEPNVVKIIWGVLGHVWMISCARHGDWPPVRSPQSQTSSVIVSRNLLYTMIGDSGACDDQVTKVTSNNRLL